MRQLHGLDPVPFAPVFGTLPPTLAALCGDAERRARALGDPARPDRCPGFEMSDPCVAWGLVSAARNLPGRRDNGFCEWGAGIGLVTFLAERAGFDARGIELESALVDAGRALAAAHGLSAPLRVGSYKPPGFFENAADGDGGAEPDLFSSGVTYVYAWPAEADHVTAFFARFAPVGAILILYLGGRSVHVLRQPSPVSPSCASRAASPLR